MKSTASEPGLIDHSNDVKMFKTEETGFTVFFFNILTSCFLVCNVDDHAK